MSDLQKEWGMSYKDTKQMIVQLIADGVIDKNGHALQQNNEDGDEPGAE